MKKFNLDNPDIDILIRQYLKGRLSSEDKQNFDRALLEDESLKIEVSFIREMQSTLQSQRRAETKEMLERIAVEHPVEEIPEASASKNTPGRNKWPMLLIAGALLGTLGLFFWLFQDLSPSQETAQLLFKNYYEPFKLTGAYDPQVLNRTSRAFNAYQLEQPDYATVAELLKNYPGATNEMDILMALGIAYIETEAWTKAAEVFTIVSQDTADSYTQDGQWYLALVFLQQRNIATARPLLEDLQDHAVYGSDAREILAQTPLNRFSKYVQ